MFFFKQKTAYEMRISDWSSDVCSSDLYAMAPDGKSVTFKIRKDAKFHDGAPVTAHDVKWSYDRAVSVGGFPTFQMKAGSLEKPEQFVVVDDYTFRVDLPKKDKLSLPDMAVVVPAIYNR